MTVKVVTRGTSNRCTDLMNQRTPRKQHSSLSLEVMIASLPKRLVFLQEMSVSFRETLEVPPGISERRPMRYVSATLC